MRKFAVSLCLLLGAAALATPESDIVGGISTSGMLDNIKYLSGATSNITTRLTTSPAAVRAQDWLVAYFQGLGYPAVTQDWGDWLMKPACDNVIVTKIGVKYPNSEYVICSHYDSTSNNPTVLAPGADDNGTGTAAVMEAARLLQNYPTDYTIEFICFSGEEQGVIGSSYYNNHPNGRTIMGAIDMDMIGYETVPNTPLYVMSATSTSPLADTVRTVSLLYNPSYTCTRYTYSGEASDNYPFYQHGIPECCVIEGTPNMIWGGSNPYYHTTNDVWTHLSQHFMGIASTATIGALARLSGVANGYATVQMAEYKGPLSSLTLTLERRNPGQTTPLATYSVTLDATGSFKVPDSVPAGTWDFALKPAGWLRCVAGSVQIPTTTGPTFALVPGDAWNDNLVDLLDLSSVLADFGTAGTTSTDIDGTGAVDLLDLSAILANFGTHGNP